MTGPKWWTGGRVHHTPSLLHQESPRKPTYLKASESRRTARPRTPWWTRPPLSTIHKEPK